MERALALVVLVACALAACGDTPVAAVAPCTPDDFEPAPAWTPVAAVTFDARGLSPAVDTADGYLSLALSDAARCVQVDTGAPSDRGPFCTQCPQRQSVAVGGGVFSFPSAPPRVEGPVTVTFGLRDCATLTPAARGDAALGATLRRAVTRAHDPRERAVLRVDVAAFGDVWAAAPDGAEALLRAATAELTDARVTLRIASHCALAAPADELVVRDRSHDEIARWTSLARARCPALARVDGDPRLTLLVAPCAWRRDTLLGESATLDGYTTHVPGGFVEGEAADAVVLSAGCGATLPRVDGVPLGLARALAHEVGHYLGLYHTREIDGVEDNLDDTRGDANLMNPSPLVAGARGLTAQQAEVMRWHPSLRWARPTRARCAEP